MKSPQSADHRGGRPELPQSNETFPHRRERPGEAGLANEVRPGLGTRGASGSKDGKVSGRTPPQDRDPLGRNKPVTRPEPREQKSDSPAHERERDTGVSGHSSAD